MKVIRYKIPSGETFIEGIGKIIGSIWEPYLGTVYQIEDYTGDLGPLKKGHYYHRVHEMYIRKL